MLKKIIYYYGLLCLLGLLAGCGFKLRGQDIAHTPSYTLYVNAAADTPLIQQLKQHLLAIGAHVVDNPQAAQKILQLSAEQFSQQLVSTNTINQINQYVLKYQISYQLKNQAGQAMGNPQIISITRTLSYNANQLLSDANNQQQLQQTMRQEAIIQIINRLYSQNRR